MSHFALRAAVAGLLLTTGIAGASAADLNRYTPAPAAAPAVVAYAFNWTGAYVGANVGANFANIGTPFGNGGSTGFAGGLQAGYLWQMPNNIVYGLEVDFDGSTNRKSWNYTATTVGGAVNNFSERERQDYQFGLRGRLGYAYDRFLPFVSVGVTWAGFNSRIVNTTTNTAFSGTRVQTGYQLGTGLEYAVTNNVTVRGEYLYSDFGRYNINGNRHFTNDNALRFSVNYKF
jgi:outer membrane immunogenic protein